LAMSLPYLATPLQQLFLDGIERTRLMPRTWSERASLPLRPAPRADR
jgi:flagellar biosynthetic protein FliR